MLVKPSVGRGLENGALASGIDHVLGVAREVPVHDGAVFRLEFAEKSDELGSCELQVPGLGETEGGAAPTDGDLEGFRRGACADDRVPNHAQGHHVALLGALSVDRDGGNASADDEVSGLTACDVGVGGVGGRGSEAEAGGIDAVVEQALQSSFPGGDGARSLGGFGAGAAGGGEEGQALKNEDKRREAEVVEHGWTDSDR